LRKSYSFYFFAHASAAQRFDSAAAAGQGKHHNYYCIFWQIAPAQSGKAAVRLEPVLGGFVLYLVCCFYDRPDI